jgi:hypothetical protein
MMMIIFFDDFFGAASAASATALGPAFGAALGAVAMYVPLVQMHGLDSLSEKRCTQDTTNRRGSPCIFNHSFFAINFPGCYWLLYPMSNGFQVKTLCLLIHFKPQVARGYEGNRLGCNAQEISVVAATHLSELRA